MADSFSKIVAIFLAALLLFVVPIKNEFERIDNTSRIYVLNETAKFVDSVRNLGYITPLMYQDYMGRLEATNNIYEVRLEHSIKTFDPVYSDPLDEDTFDGDYLVGFNSYYNNVILPVLFPDPPIDEDADRTYRLSRGDYFTVTVFNKNKTMATKLQEMLYNGNAPVTKIYVRYGGMVKDENN
jgi:hypothetical protein